MIKRLTILFELLMVISVFCIGFASWNVKDMIPVSESVGGSIIADEADTISPSDLGISYHRDISPDVFSVGIKADSAGTPTNYVLMSSILSLQVNINKSNFNPIEYLEFDNFDLYYLKASISYTNANYDLFTGSILKKPDKVKVMLSNMESVYFLCDYESVKNGNTYELVTYIPLKTRETACLYNIVNYDYSSNTKIPVTISYDFEGSWDMSEAQYNALKSQQFNFSLTITSK